MYNPDLVPSCPFPPSKWRGKRRGDTTRASRRPNPGQLHGVFQDRVRTPPQSGLADHPCARQSFVGPNHLPTPLTVHHVLPPFTKRAIVSDYPRVHCLLVCGNVSRASVPSRAFKRRADVYYFSGGVNCRRQELNLPSLPDRLSVCALVFFGVILDVGRLWVWVRCTQSKACPVPVACPKTICSAPHH